MPKMEHCVIIICFLIKLEKRSGSIFLYENAQGFKGLYYDNSGERIACYGDSLLRKDVFPSLREGSLQLKWAFSYNSQKTTFLIFAQRFEMKLRRVQTENFSRKCTQI